MWNPEEVMCVPNNSGSASVNADSNRSHSTRVEKEKKEFVRKFMCLQIRWKLRVREGSVQENYLEGKMETQWEKDGIKNLPSEG